MWWELLRYPTGDAQAQVFWRRRMSVLAVVAVLGVLVLVLLLRGGGSDSVTPTAAEQPAPAGTGGAPVSAPGTAAPGASAPGAAAGPSAKASAAPTATAAATRPDPATTCTPGTMALRLASDTASYPAGAQPMLTLSLVDVGNQPCVVDLGPTATSVSVLSAGKPVWTSTACANRVPRPTQLTPAAAQMLQLRWDRTSNIHDCGTQAPLPAGQYEIIARVGNSAVYGGSFALA
jgi:hypothetical protein